MKATIDARALAAAVARVAPFAARTTALPVLFSVQITAGDGELTLTCTDIERVAQTTVAAEVADGGTACVPAALLAKAASKLVGTAELIVEGTEVAVSDDATVFQLHTAKAEDFPRIGWPEAELTPLGGAWGRVLRVGTATAEKNEAHPTAIGIAFGADGRVAASDGYRCHWTHGVPGGHEGYVPKPLLDLAAKVLGDEVSMAITDRMALFADQSTTIAGQLVAHEAPSFWSIIPTSTPHTVSVDAAELLSAIDVATAIETDGSNTVRLSIDGDLATLRRAGDEGAAEVTFEVDGEIGGESIGLPATYLVSAVRAVGGERVHLGVTAPMKPVLIPGDEVSAMVMPTRLVGK